MSTTPVEQYLERLEDLLPAAEARRVLPEVREMILDRVDAEMEGAPDIDQAEAESRALASWDPPETLAGQLTTASLTIDVATRRAFVRTLLALFAGHLAFAIVLTGAGSAGTAIPGFLGPLPMQTFLATILGALSILCIDAGIVFLLFVLLGRSRSRLKLPYLDLKTHWTRRDGIQGLILTALLVLVFNMFLDTIFALREGDTLTPFLSDDLKALLPWLNVVLGIFAVRHLLTALGRSERVETHVVDALASLAAAVLAILAATRANLVTLPDGALGPDRTDILEDLMDRVFLVVFVVAALLLAVRFVKRALRTSRLLAARDPE
ncbi:MAG: hypothetical protein QNJ98_11570 [Planctomycetota bacterium]|nr:hypothetical protein [Planctomycetota bacterium]